MAESRPGRIHVFRLSTTGKVATDQVFATGLNMPYGIAFYPPGPNPTHVYIGNTDSVVRFPYQNGDLKARGGVEPVVKSLPSGAEVVGGGGFKVATPFEQARLFITLFLIETARPGCQQAAKSRGQFAGRD